MSEEFAASVRALELPNDAALVKAMGRGELEARVREYARAEAVAPADVQADIIATDGARKHYLTQAGTARQAGNEELARSADVLSQVMTTARERLQVADAARREWEEATAAKAEAASQARAELGTRGPARWDEGRPQSQAAAVREAQAETAAGIDKPEPGQEIGQVGRAPNVEVEAWPEAQAEMAAEVDPEALTVMAAIDADMAAIDDSAFDDNLARAEAGAERLAEKRARDQAERERAAIDEPVAHAEAQAELEATAAADKAEVNADADLEIRRPRGIKRLAGAGHRRPARPTRVCLGCDPTTDPRRMSAN